MRLKPPLAPPLVRGQYGSICPPPGLLSAMSFAGLFSAPKGSLAQASALLECHELLKLQVPNPLLT